MVLPPSTADHATGTSRAWLSRIARILELAGNGVIVLVTGARPTWLRALVLTLDDAVGHAHERDHEPAQAPGQQEARVHACLHAPEVMDVPADSTVVLRLDQADAAWLNEHRPLFAQRRLRVVLWADDDAAVALRRRAPDFFDWISHVIECPDGVPAFAVAGLRQAPAYPGIVWRGRDLDAALGAAFPGEPITRVSAAAPYGRLVEAASRTPGWLVWTDVAMPPDLVRIRWSLAESGRPDRVIIEEPRCATPGWWPASGNCLPWTQAADMLARHGIEHAARVAALLDLEPAALQLAIELIAPSALDALVRRGALAAGDDPGAEVARVAAEQGLVSPIRVVHRDHAPPVLRAFQEDAEVVAHRQAIIVLVDLAVREWSEQAAGEAGLPPWTLNAGDLIAWANARPAEPPPLPDPCPAHPSVAHWLEAVLAARGLPDHGPESGPERQSSWNAAVKLAIWVGQYEIAGHWAESHDVATQVRAVALYQQGRYSQAEDLLRQALARPEGAADHAVWVHLQVLLAATLKDQGKYAEAEARLREIAGAEGGAALHLLAEVLAAQGKHDEAESLFLRSIARIEQERGPGDPLYGIALHELAGALQHQGRLDQAEAHARKALDIKQSTHGPEHPSYAATLELLAAIQTAQGKHEQAETLYRQSMEIEAQQIGVEHPRHTRARSELGLVLGKQGKYDQAEQLLRASLASAERTLGTSHPSYAMAARNLGTLLADRGEYIQAEELLRQALAVQERALGAEHLDVADTLTRLALVLARQDRSADARAVAQRARAIADARAGPNHPLTAEIAALLSGT